jgi:hypothetical protein
MLWARGDRLPNVAGRVLVLVCSFRGGVHGRPAWSLAARVPRPGRIAALVDRLTFLPLRRSIAANRDFFANPRDVAYQADLVRDVLGLGQPSEVVCVLDDRLPPTEAFQGLGRIEYRPASAMALDAERFETIVVVYPDALGLGWGALERALRRSHPVSVLCLNGRRRVMPLHRDARRALGVRRLLAVTRLPELGFALAVLPVAAICAAIDAVRGRS